MEELKKKIGLDYNRLSRMSIVEDVSVKVFYKQHELIHFTKTWYNFALLDELMALMYVCVFARVSVC